MAVDVLMNSRRYDSPVWSLITLDSHSSSDRDQIVPPLESKSVRLCVCTPAPRTVVRKEHPTSVTTSSSPMFSTKKVWLCW